MSSVEARHKFYDDNWDFLHLTSLDYLKLSFNRKSYFGKNNYNMASK